MWKLEHEGYLNLFESVFNQVEGLCLSHLFIYCCASKADDNSSELSQAEFNWGGWCCDTKSCWCGVCKHTSKCCVWLHPSWDSSEGVLLQNLNVRVVESHRSRIADVWCKVLAISQIWTVFVDEQGWLVRSQAKDLVAGALCWACHRSEVRIVAYNACTMSLVASADRQVTGCRWRHSVKPSFDVVTANCAASSGLTCILGVTVIATIRCVPGDTHRSHDTPISVWNCLKGWVYVDLHRLGDCVLPDSVVCGIQLRVLNHLVLVQVCFLIRLDFCSLGDCWVAASQVVSICS